MHHWVCKLSKEDAETFNMQFIDIIETPFLAPFLAKAVTGASIMTMTDAIIDIKNPQLYIPEDATVHVHTHRFERKGATDSEGRSLGGNAPEGDEKGPSTIGTLRTLVIRLTDGDNVPVTASIDKLKDDVFDDISSLKTQTEACSYGKLKIVPFEGNTPSNKYISNGIVDVKMDYRMTSDEQDRDQAALAAAKDQLGDLDDDMFDLILICFPPGGGNWIASANANSKFSFYNDKWCSPVSSQMHEVGHNLGLGHSGQSGGTNSAAAYGDTTGIMGSSLNQDDLHMCYNPQKSYQLGWYDDKIDTINPLDGVPRREFTLNGVSDYEKNNDALIALRLKQVHIENKDYYIGFNRADGINQNTREDKNMVTINRKEEGDVDEYGQSTKVASLKPGERYVIQDFDNRKDITIAFIGLKNWDARIVVLEGDNLPPPPGDCQKFTIELTTDLYPEDTLWYFTDTGDIGYVGGLSPVYYEQLKRQDTEVCLPMGKSAETYEFTIFDRSGDGLANGKASVTAGYKIRDDSGQVVVSGDDKQFEFRTHYVEVRKDPNPPPPTKAPTQAPTAKPTPTPPCETYTVEVLTDTFPEDTSWQIVGFNHFNEDFIFDEKSVYEQAHHLHKDTVCLPQGKTYKFRVSDIMEDGLCCGAGYGYYRLIDRCGNVIVDSGMKEDAFEVKEYTFEVDNFCVTDKPTEKAPVVVSNAVLNPSSDAQCEDERKEKEKFRIKEDGAKNTCQFLGSKNKCDQMITTGKNENQFVWEVCQNSCNRCGNSPSINNLSVVSLSVSNNNKCNDEKKEKLKFRIKDGAKKSTCKVYADKGKCDTVITTGKSKNKKLWEICKNSCNKC